MIPIQSAPNQNYRASVAPPEVTSYPEYPTSEFSSPLAFDIDGAVLKVALKSKQETVLKQEMVLNATATRDFAHLGRAKQILLLSQSNSAKLPVMPIE